jgi:hypothetical protein
MYAPHQREIDVAGGADPYGLVGEFIRINGQDRDLVVGPEHVFL